ncbi:MAG: hypothetical protein GY705_31480, partial [Bacteroidetes bacterium]|nr:hypothetical protein [Bacteroidota bacterium]
HEVDIALHKHGTRWGIYSPLSQEVVLALPVNNSCINNGSLGVMIAPLTVVEAVKKSQPIIFLYIITNALVLATLCFFRFSKIVIQPLKNLVTISENYSDKEMIFFSSDTSNSDFRKLSTALNSMISRIESDRKQLRQNISSLQHANDQLIASQKEMVRAEKLAAIGRLSAGLAHEIGNPIGIVQGYIELLGNDDISQEDRKQFSQRADKEVQRIDKLVRQLLDLTRLPSSASGTAHVNVVLDTISEIFTTHKDMEKIDIIKTLEAKNDLVAVHKDSLHQVLLNCLLNSIDAIIEKTGSKEGTITLYSKNSFQGQKEVYCLEIQDNGIGIKEEDFDSVLDPFFSTKEPGKGTGLGLSVSASIIEGIGGKITLKSEYEKGTVVSLTLPISHESSPTDSTKNSELKG